MGKPKFSRKKYETPKHPWQEERIKEEDELIKKYGLKNKKEIWKAKTQLRRYRSQARELLASVRTGDEQSKKESDQLLNSLSRMSILPTKSTLDDVLALETESILSRRLQTITYLKGFASTPNQARQLITHGHIKVGERRVTIPSYMLTKNEENTISYTEASPLNDSMHPARPKSDFRGETRKKAKPEEQKEEKPEKDEKKEEKTEESKETKEEVKQEETKKEEQDVKTEEPKETKEEKTEETDKTEEKPKEEAVEESPSEEKKKDDNEKKEEAKGGKE